MVDFLISLVFLAVLMVWYRAVPPPQIVLLPVFILFALAASFGAGVWIAALTVRYRDFRFIIPFVVQFGLYISPVGFASTIVPEKWRLIYFLNPVAGVIDGFRWCILGGMHELYLPGIAVSFATATVVIMVGIWYFRATESEFADII
jgi:lipopolysaccharide transport system permease protein